MRRDGGVDERFAAYVRERGEHHLRVAVLLTGDWHAAQDLVQASLVKLYRAWPRLDTGAGTDAYVPSCRAEPATAPPGDPAFGGQGPSADGSRLGPDWRMRISGRLAQLAGAAAIPPGSQWAELTSDRAGHAARGSSGEAGHDGYMARFASYDGTQIGYRVLGAGPPLVCLPGGAGAFNPTAAREAVGRLVAPVLVYAGELDASPVPAAAAAAARLFPDATVTVQPGAAHFPWLDDPAFFTAAITSFLS
jgi:pimeloyl-ACP methyl ester carboxylesterase